MRKILIILFFFSVLFAGCQDVAKKDTIEVTIKGNGRFPLELAGTWKAQGKTGWELVFEPDGYISSAVIEFGKTSMEPGQTTKYPTKYGGKGIFEPGKWKVYYEPRLQRLTVEINVKHFYQDLGKYAMEGSISDFLVGEISEDGKTWVVDWFNAIKVTALLPKPTIIEDMTELEYKEKLVFEKVSNENGK